MPKQTSGMWTPSESACIWRASSRYGWSTAAAARTSSSIHRRVSLNSRAHAQRTSETEIRFDESGLVPCVVQDWATGEVLTLAYMNEEALRAHPRDRGDPLLQPLARGALAQGRDLGQHPAVAPAALRLRRRRAGRAGRAGRPGLSHRRALVLPPRPRERGERPRPPPTRRSPRSSARSPTRADERPEGSYTVELLDDPERIGAKVREEADEVARAAARRVGRARGRGGRRRPLPPPGAAALARGAAERGAGDAQWPSPLSARASCRSSSGSSTTARRRSRRS